MCDICRWQLQLTDTVCLPDKLAIFHTSSAQYPVRARAAVVYFTVQSWLRVVINYLWPPETDQNMPYYPPLSLASTEFHENIEILRKQANSAALLKTLRSVENCGL